jgi:hypothetical protein
MSANSLWDSPCAVPCQPNATSDVLDIVVVDDFVLPLHLTVCSALSTDHQPVLIDTTCLTSSPNPLSRPDFTRTDWAAFQACLEDRLLGNRDVNEETIDRCVEELTSDIQGATAACQQRGDPRPPLPVSIQDKICLKYRLKRQCKATRDPHQKNPSKPPPDAGNLSAERVEERIVEHYAGIPGLCGPVVMEDDKEGDASSDSFTPLQVPGGSSFFRLRERESPGQESWGCSSR